jgi:hypothetical protein
MNADLWGRPGSHSSLPEPIDAQAAFDRDDMLWRLMAALAMVVFASVIAGVLV